MFILLKALLTLVRARGYLLGSAGIFIAGNMLPVCFKGGIECLEVVW